MVGKELLIRMWIALGCALPCVTVHAHGEPPSAYTLLASDADGVSAVRLSAGIAQRRGRERFQFICPAAWGDEYTAPAAALADGTLVIGATSGLTLLAADGTLQSHPSEAALGYSTELVRSDEGVFALRNTQGQAEILHITSQDARIVWTDTRSWHSLAAHQNRLVLLRMAGTNVEQTTLSAQGAELERQQAIVTWPVDYAFVRSSGDAAYVLLTSQLRSDLGRLQDGNFVSLVSGAGRIAGPITHSERLLIGGEGKLQRVGANGALVDLGDQTYVRCLDRAGDTAYACTLDGLAQLGPEGVGAPLFLLSWLVPPDLAALKDERARERCEYQWQDIRFDLLALNTVLLAEQETDASVREEEVQTDSAAAEPTRSKDAGTPGQEGPVRRSSSCDTLAKTPSGWRLPWLWMVPAVALLRRRVLNRS